MFESLMAGTVGAGGAAAVEAWSQVESAACARRLAAMVTMLEDAHAASGSASRDQWCIDNWSAVCAHIGAAQRLTWGAASNLLLVGIALRDRYPKVAAVFAEGLIGYPLVRTIVTRAALVVDPDALRALDAAMAEALRGWEPLSVDKTEKTIDAMVARWDPHAVRRTRNEARNRSVEVVIQDGTGMAEVFGSLFTPDAKALDARLNAFAETICAADPRTRDQRRADAMGALARGADRLTCLCGTDDCPAADAPASTGVVVYVISHHDTITTSEPAASGPDGPEPVDPEPVDPEPVDPEPVDPEPVETAPSRDDDDDVDECAGLDGVPPPSCTTPLRDLTLVEALTDTDPGRLATIRPAAMMGGGLLPGAIARRAAQGATLTPIVHPGKAPPEPRYTPSKKLADFVRCRDLTCRFPGCRAPATECDVDHTIPWPYGPTSASNLKALCRRHHLLKTFWGGENGWRERQLDDGTIIWTAPDGREHVTTPGSRLLFPSLSQPTAPLAPTTVPSATVPSTYASGLTMPRRQRTRAEDRARRIHDERELNRIALAEPPAPVPATTAATVEEPITPDRDADPDPPPF